MTIESAAIFSIGKVSLNSGPIRSDWILEGNPVSCNRILSTSKDYTSSTLMWDCTAGRFNWYYDVDETLYVIEGSVTIKDEAGVTHQVSAGDTVFFPAGSRAEWHVEKYIRKIAFCRAPVPGPVVFWQRGIRFLKRRLGLGNKSAAPAMFGTD